MLDSFFAHGFKDVDTALTYSGGKTEAMIGELMPPGSERASKCGVLATKAGPWQGGGMSGNGELTPLLTCQDHAARRTARPVR
jgi:aryl-alcohol dehydrogenase-like predicted oxidoreductase